MSDASRRGRASRRKGKDAELEVVHIFRNNGYPYTERTQRGTAQRGDLAKGPKATLIEIRRRENLPVAASMREVIARAEPHELPLLVHRPSRCPWLVTLELTELLALLQLRETA